MFDSDLFDGGLFDPGGALSGPPPLVLQTDLRSILMSVDTDPFGIDSEQTFGLSPDDDPFGIDSEQTFGLSPDDDPFGIDPEQTSWASL
jgi:hypothetical protein